MVETAACSIEEHFMCAECPVWGRVDIELSDCVPVDYHLNSAQTKSSFSLWYPTHGLVNPATFLWPWIILHCLQEYRK